MKRSELKTVIKECLIEILTEGVGSSLNESINSSKQLISNKKSLQHAPTASKSELVNRHLLERDITENVARTATSMTNDPVLAEILRDTAMTTLQEQMSADRMHHGKINQSGFNAMSLAKINDGVNIEEFDGSNNWATLAFK